MQQPTAQIRAGTGSNFIVYHTKTQTCVGLLEKVARASRALEILQPSLKSCTSHNRSSSIEHDKKALQRFGPEWDQVSDFFTASFTLGSGFRAGLGTHSSSSSNDQYCDL